MFARFGIPSLLITNKVLSISLQFKTFAKDWGIQIKIFSPNYSSSNGPSENYLEIIKKKNYKKVKKKRVI